MNRIPILSRALGLACAIAAAPVLAADAPPPAKPAAKPATKSAEPRREGALGKGTSTAPVLTKEQLRQCLAEQDRIKSESASLQQMQQAMEKDRVEIERTGNELEADKATLDRTSEAAINAYNERARQRAKMVEAFKAAAPPFNDRVDKLGADRQAFAKDCADRRFFEDDFDAIKAGK